ncbi:hypothetical protein ABZ412_15740 [Nocardia sp. NPDC005746]|uniref:hypothetical protein n=1 Tax=Nocardia sp. NPDC005746 TaxID=3157062 RepID=UPI0033EFEAEE
MQHLRQSVRTFLDGSAWPEGVDDASRREQAKLMYDYIKFHIGLYLATPAAIGLLGSTFAVADKPSFQVGLATMMVIYLGAGLHASRFMGRFINVAWDQNVMATFEDKAFTFQRRVMHHWTYWLGLIIGLAGLLIAKL